MRGLRGVAAGVLTLVALQVLGTGQGPERGGQLVAWIGKGMQRLMSPGVPGVPRVASAPPGKAPAKPAPASSNEIGGTLPRNPPTVYV